MSRAGHACYPACEERAAATVAGTFRWVDGMGWVDVLAPKRRSSPVAIVKHGMGRLPELYDGWPYTHTCGPWCGGDLGEGES